jgi:hypothetical protein
VVCDKDLTMASERLLDLSNEIANIASEDRDTHVNSIENILLKRDLARLLKVLDNYPSANGFLSHWRDSRGMSYIGPLTYGEDVTKTWVAENKRILNSIRAKHGDANNNNYPVPYSLEVRTMHGLL